MRNSILSKMEILSCPNNCLSRSRIRDKNVYVSETPEVDTQNFVEVVPGIFVSPKLQDSFTEEYFNTKLQGKNIYAPLFLYGGYLPTTTGAKILVLNEGETLPEDWDYKMVDFREEISLGDLYKNVSAYQYNKYTDSFLRLPEIGAQQNSLKLVMQKEIMTIAGDAYDRIADMNRIILFLLSKVGLTEQEKQSISQLLSYAQNIGELGHIFDRELSIQEYIASVKNNPGGYINGQ